MDDSTPTLPARSQPPNAAYTADDPALREAWRCIFEYALASTWRKNTHVRIRLRVIALTAAATILATIAALLVPLNAPELIGLKLALRVLLVVVPLIIAGTLAYSLQFMPNTTWIAYRIGEQMIRREVYLYRLRVGDYAPARQPQHRLLDRIAEIDRKVEQLGASQPHMQNFSDSGSDDDTPPTPRHPAGWQRLLARYVGQSRPRVYTLDTQARAFRETVHLPAGDDGFSAMGIDEYLLWRLDDQREWYVNKLNTDHHLFRRWRLVFLIVTGLGALLAGLEFGWLVAVTTALGVAITMYIDLQMYGRTYSTYHYTAKRLRSLKTSWEVDAAARGGQPATETAVIAFVDAVEALFADERRRWLEEALQSQQSVDQSIAQSLSLADPGRRMGDAPNRARVSANPFSDAAALRRDADLHRTAADEADARADAILGQDDDASAEATDGDAAGAGFAIPAASTVDLPAGDSGDRPSVSGEFSASIADSPPAPTAAPRIIPLHMLPPPWKNRAPRAGSSRAASED